MPSRPNPSRWCLLRRVAAGLCRRPTIGVPRDPAVELAGRWRRDRTGANEALADALANCREVWELKSTADNLRLIIDSGKRRGEDVAWVEEIESVLRDCAASRR